MRIQAVLDQAADAPVIAVAETLRHPHPVVKAWIEEDDKRVREARRNRWAIGGEDWSDGRRPGSEDQDLCPRAG